MENIPMHIFHFSALLPFAFGHVCKFERKYGLVISPPFSSSAYKYVTHLIYSSLEAINFACCKRGLGRNMCCTSYAFCGFVFVIAPFQFFMALCGIVRRQKQRFHEFFFLWPFYASSSVQRRSLFLRRSKLNTFINFHCYFRIRLHFQST